MSERGIIGIYCEQPGTKLYDDGKLVFQFGSQFECASWRFPVVQVTGTLTATGPCVVYFDNAWAERIGYADG